ncbi:MAG: alpha/beta hydrolase [Planctomycetota bacterium]|nr:alpha/beta hydrolase [Planctomycetota bacterium]
MVRFRWRWRGFVFPGDPVFDPETGGMGRRSSQTAPERFRAGLVVSLDGVGGYNWGPRWIRRGLDLAGVRSAIVIYDWTVGPAGMFLADLVAEERNRATALHLADWIAAYARAMPGRPVTLIGHSGGAAVAVWALEALPEDVRVRRAVLLAPALGPAYNLGPALRAVEDRLVATCSWADAGMLAAATTVFGTMDRRHSPGAGFLGFRMPENLASDDLEAYEKVRQVRWTPSLVRHGNLGGHMGWTTARFAREFLAPIVTGASDPGEPIASFEGAAAGEGEAG